MLIINACMYGWTDLVKLLLQDPRVNPSARNNLALDVAKRNGRSDIVELLLSDVIQPKRSIAESMIEYLK